MFHPAVKRKKSDRRHAEERAGQRVDQRVEWSSDVSRTSSDTSYPAARSSRLSSLKLALGALGVVYGDIGTSPLYALRECFSPALGVPLQPASVFGILSLIFWSLTLVVTVKYLSFILKADNKGEGGVMALIAMIRPSLLKTTGRKGILTIGLFGAALLFGDGVITPAISVLSAVEGLEVAAPVLEPFVIPVTIVILLGLFSVQQRGTARIGAVFGPAMLIWFIAIAAIGIPPIIARPEILGAVSPLHALSFLAEHKMAGVMVLSAVVLTITGAEALYADMGHFGKHPIRMSWVSIVFPSLLLNYLGQGALVLGLSENLPSGEPPSEAALQVLRNPFYALVPSGWLYPFIGLATLATVIASQALISGAYSLTQQAIQLGYLPRTQISHTSRETEGQIYVAQVNWYLMLGCIGLVLLFRHSSGLAAAYGIAVTGTMLATTFLYLRLIRAEWQWSRLKAFSLISIFFIVDGAFFTANFRKLFEGGWIPILLASALFIIMTTWKRGREIYSELVLANAMPLDDFLKILARKKPQRVPGTAVFMTLTQDIAPPVLQHHVRHNRVLHERLILLSIITRNEPIVDDRERVKITELPLGFYKIQARYGYMETPDISEILIFILGAGLELDINELSFYLGRESFMTTGESKIAQWRKRLFVVLSRNARPATDFFRIPPNQVIEIGLQVEI